MLQPHASMRWSLVHWMQRVGSNKELTVSHPNWLWFAVVTAESKGRREYMKFILGSCRNGNKCFSFLKNFFLSHRVVFHELCVIFLFLYFVIDNQCFFFFFLCLCLTDWFKKIADTDWLQWTGTFTFQDANKWSKIHVSDSFCLLAKNYFAFFFAMFSILYS